MWCAHLGDLGDGPGVALVGADHLAEDGLHELRVAQHRLGQRLGLAAQIRGRALQAVERREPAQRRHQLALAAGRALEDLDLAEDEIALRIVLERLFEGALGQGRVADLVLAPRGDAHPEIARRLGAELG